MKRLNFCLYIATTLIFSFITTKLCIADVPHVFTFQGYATNAQGQPLQSEHQAAFAIYDSVIDGTLLWSEPASNLAFTNGYFTKILGQVTPFPPDFFNPERWLQVTIEGQALAPRERFTSLPWSLETERVDSRQLYIDPSTGNVGIGTTNPDANLTIKGNLSRALTGIVGVPSGSTQVTGVGTLFSQELVIGDAIKIGGEVFTVAAIDSDTSLLLDSPHQVGAVNVTAYSDNRLLEIQNGDSGSKVVIDKSGNVGIGTTSPGYGLDVSANNSITARFSGGGPGYNYASIRLQNVNPGGSTWAFIVPDDCIGDPAMVGGLGVFDWNAAEYRLFLNRNGCVGIGRTNPTYKLSVYNQSGHGGLFELDNGNGTALSAYNNGTGAGAGLYATHSDMTNGWAARFLGRVYISGNVGIGTNPTHLLELSGGAYCDGSQWVPASSREYKDNIRDLTTNEAVSALEQLRPTKFNYKTNPSDECLGFIAEDVPDLVATNDRKGVNPMDIVAVLTKVVQEQQSMLLNQQAQLDEMKQKLDALTRAAH